VSGLRAKLGQAGIPLPEGWTRRDHSAQNDLRLAQWKPGKAIMGVMGLVVYRPLHVLIDGAVAGAGDTRPAEDRACPRLAARRINGPLH
jgi:hypothetical protein